MLGTLRKCTIVPWFVAFSATFYPPQCHSLTALRRLRSALTKQLDIINLSIQVALILGKNLFDESSTTPQRLVLQIALTGL